jgi:hypothetical protein
VQGQSKDSHIIDQAMIIDFAKFIYRCLNDSSQAPFVKFERFSTAQFEIEKSVLTTGLGFGDLRQDGLASVALVEGPSTEREMHNVKEDLGNATEAFSIMTIT